MASMRLLCACTATAAALVAPVPPDWERGVSDSGTPYHFNTVSGASIWEHPLDEHYRKMFAKAKKAKATKDDEDTSELDLLSPGSVGAVSPTPSFSLEKSF